MSRPTQHDRSERRLRASGAILLACLGATGCAAGQRVNEASLAARAPEAAELGIDTTLASGARALLDPERRYELGPEDVLALRVLDLERVSHWSELELEIGPEGTIDVPLVGRLEAAGRTTAALRTELLTRLAERFLYDPQVSLTIARFRSRRIAVLGAVAEPGIKALERNSVTITEALALAGGPTEDAGAIALLFEHSRAGSRLEPIEISLEDVAARPLEHNFALRPGDVLHVLPAPAIHVTGYVYKPGEFRLRRRLTVMGAIALAGGVQVPEASPSETFVRRRRPDGGETFLRVDLVAVSEGRAQDVEVQPGDIIEVQQTAARYLAVGAYEFFRGFVNFGFNVASLF